MKTFEHGSRTRFVADRFRRIWAMAQEIADHPGQSRHELSVTYHISERQLQSDINIIRSDMRLPLIRQQGYRFADEGAPSGAGALTLHDALVLISMATWAGNARKATVAPLMAKLPHLFPAHLRPIAARLMQRAGQQGKEDAIFTALTEAILQGSWVKLTFPVTYEGPDRSPVVKPELIVPYLNSWYLLAECLHGLVSSRMFRIDDVASVTAVAISD